MEIWIYLLVFAVILFFSSYKMRGKFAPKYLFTFKKSEDIFPEQLHKRLDLAAQNLWFLKDETRVITGGWMLTRDGFLISPIQAGKTTSEKVNASNDGVNFTTTLFWIHTTKSGNQALFKYAGVWSYDPLLFLNENEENPGDLFIPVFTDSGLSWKKIHNNENNQLVLEIENAGIFAGHPVLSEKGYLFGFIRSVRTIENGIMQIDFHKAKDVLNALKIKLS